MKSIKTSLAGFLAMVLVFSGLFLTCDVGLGDSVDTKPPKVSVTSPAVDSVLAGAFSLQGTASDETALKGVSVIATETTTGAVYGPYKANLDSSSKTWSVNINETDANGAYVIPDGMYQLTITATDKANRSSVATTVYQIDNHLPTVLVTSPLSYGVAKTTFYRTIDIKGEAYDGSTIQEVIVQLVNADGAVVTSAKADGTNTWFARFDYKASDTTLADNAVYGMNVLAKDMAGNVNTYYYHRSDIYPVLSVGSDGYVTFPSMNQIGKVDQGLSAETDQGLTKDELAVLRHGPAATAAIKYPDFIYRNVEPPKVQWLNVTDAKKTIGLSVPIVGTILPPTDGSSIVESSITFSISNVITPAVSIPQPASRVSLSNVASSYNFEVKPGNASNDDLGTGLYVIKVTYKTVGGLTLEATREFGIASGAPTVTETGVAPASSPFNFTKTVKGSATLSGFAKTSDGNRADLEYSDTYNGTTTASPVTVASDGAYSIPLTFAGVDGTHTIQLTASSGGLTASLSRILVVDTNDASIVFLNPVDALTPCPVAIKTGPNYFIAANGTADDGVGSGVAKVYAIVGTASTDYVTGGAYDFAATWTECTGTVNWSATVPVAPATEGLKYLFVAAVDAAGNARISNVDFSFDVTDPVADFSDTAGLTAFTSPDTEPSTNNASFTLQGNAHDDGFNTSDATYKVASSISLSCVKNGTVFDLVPPAGGVTDVTIATTNSGTGKWTWTPSTPMTDGLYTFTLTVRDDAGKIKTAEQKVLVDTHGPTITVATPAADALYVSTPANANVIIADSGVDYLVGAVTFTSTNGASNQVRNGNSWTADLALSGEGAKTLTVTATDRLGNSTTSPVRTFYYDTQPPTLNETEIATPYQNPGFKLAGTMGDTNGLKSLVITQQRNGGTIETIYSYTNIAAGATAFDVMTSLADATGDGVALPRDPASPLSAQLTGVAADGQYEYVLTLTDKANRQTVAYRTVKIDNTIPTLGAITVAGPNTNISGLYYSGDVTFSGTSTDGNLATGASGVDVVKYSPDGSTWSNANGTDYWSITLPFSTMNEGSYSYVFRATDKKGLNSTNSLAYAVNIDHEYPRATFDAPGGDFLEIDAVNHVYAIDGSFTLGGTADDDLSTHNVGVRGASSAVLSWTKDGLANGSTSVLPAPGVSAWTWPSGALADGMYVFTLTMTDVAGKVSTATRNVRVDTTAPTLAVTTPQNGQYYTASPLTIGGTIQDFGVGFNAGNPVDAVSYVLTNNGTVHASQNTTVTTGGAWSKSISFAAGQEAEGEGEKTIVVTAKDKLGNAVPSSTITFYYDNAAPSLVVAGTSPYVTNANVSFSGTWDETNCLKTINIAYRKDGTTDGTFELITIPALTSHGSGIAWSSATHALADGSYAFTITATDIAGRTAVVNRSMVVDTYQPTISITTPLATTKFVENSLSISGVADDGDASVTRSGLDEVRYYIDSAPGAWGTWIPVTGLQNWNDELDISALPVGTHTLYVRTRDKAGNPVAANASRAFTVDRANPVIAEPAYVGTVYRTGDFTMTVTVDEDYAFGAMASQWLTASLTSGPSGATVGTLTLDSGASTLVKKVYTYTQTGPLDGVYVIAFTARDSVDRTASISRTVNVDKTPPLITAVTNLSAGWKTSTTLSITGSASDGAGSGIVRTEYRKSSDGGATWDHAETDDWNALNGTTSFSGNVILSEGVQNRIEIRAIDKAGNKTNLGDTINNTPLVRQSISVDTEDPDVDIAVVPAAATPYNDRTRSLNVDVTGNDGTSGLVRAYASLDKTFALSAPVTSNLLAIGTTYRIVSLGSSNFSLVGAGPTPSVGTVFTATSTTPGDGTASAFTQPVLFKTLIGATDTETFDVHTLFASSSGTTKVYFRVEDTAGRYSIPYPQPVVVDVTPPTAHVTSHKDGDDVNGLITISGSSADNIGLAEANSIAVYVYRYNTGTTAWEWVAAPSGTLTQGTAWKLTDFDTNEVSANGALYDQNTGNGEDNIQLRIRVISTDLAGNTSSEVASSVDPANANYYECILDVTQNSDRPTVKFNNLTLRDTALMSSGHPVWLNGTNTLYGSVTDDDALSGLTMGIQYKFGSATDFSSGTITVANGTWSAALPSGDGSYVIAFTVTDSEGKTFTSKAVVTTADLLSTFILTDGNDTIGAKGTPPYSFDTYTYLKEDMVAPDVSIGGISIDGTNWITSGYSSVTLGGAARSMNGIASSVAKTFRLSGIAKDANGIMELKLVTSGLAGVAAQTLTATPDAGTGAYTFTGIDCNAGTGTMLITVTATDNANIIRTSSLSLAVDNAVPVVSPISPNSATTCSGQVTAYGTVNENVSQVSYAISVSGTQSPDNATALTSWEDAFDTSKPLVGGLSGHSAYATIDDASFTWYVYFDGDTDPSLTTEHSVILNAHLVNIGVTTQALLDANSFKDVVKLYLWVKATDVAGNVTEKPHLMLLDPQGGRPKVSLSYPEANGVSLGDIVRLNGSATDDGSVKGVFVQLVSGAHNLGTYTPRSGATYGTIVANAGTNTYVVPVPTAGDLDYMASLGFDVYQISAYESPTDNVKWVKGVSTLAAPADGLDWGLLASFGGSSWNYNINRQGELNPTSGSTNPVGIRIIASDSDPTPTTSIALDRVVLFDADLPVIKNVYLVQSGSVDYSAANTASREYMDDMWVSGAWYLSGTATDSNEIRTLTVNGNVIVSGGVAVAGGTTWDVDVSTDKKTVNFKYALATATGVGKVSFTMFAEDNTGSVGEGHVCTPKTVAVNYDNTKPVLTVSGASYKIDPKVRQSNNFYTLSSEATELPDGLKNQSGFARTAVYFLRRDLTGTPSYSVFDPMISKGAAGNKVNIGSAINASAVNGSTPDGTVVYKSGLYWKYRILDTRDPMDLSKLTLDGPADANIHIGGLVEIGNALYTVKSVLGDVVTIDGNPEVSYTTANFALSVVVDNTVTESSDGAISTVAGYGYGYNTPLNDDFDRMIEGVTKSGTSWTWEANICSKNIPDGPIEIHYVVFDKAGNFSVGTSGNVAQATYAGGSAGYLTREVADSNNAYYVFGQYSYGVNTPAFVSNHAPRIAGVQVGSDVNNDGSIGAGEWNTTKAAPPTYDVKSLETSIVLGSTTTPLLTAKGYTVIKPEIVGGNGAINYSYSYQSDTGTMSGNNATSLGNGIDNGLDEDSLDTLANINLQLGDLLVAGKTAGTLGNEANMPFTFTLWDSTEGTTKYSTSQNVVITLHMGVQVKDTENPVARITPFHWANATDNSVYNKSGHIELEEDWALADGYSAVATTGTADGDPKVSGQIVLKGTVSDNRQLSALYMSVTGMDGATRLNGAYATPPAGIAPSVTVGATYYLVATCSGGTWTGLTAPATYTGRGFNFAVDPSVYDSNGHSTSWTFTWNTEMIAGVADDDVEVRILALDKGIPACASSTTPDTTYKYPSVDGTHFYADPTYSGARNSGNAATQTTVGTKTALYKMDVVPYILGVKTNLSFLKTQTSSVYDRTALGHYPLSSTWDAYFYGYNLVAGATVTDSASHSVTLGAANTTKHTGYAAYPAAVSTFTSGAVSVTVGTVTSLNNANDNESNGSYAETSTGETGDYDVYLNYYNRQPNKETNNLLTDDVVFDVWKVKNSARSQSGTLNEPIMRIAPVATDTASDNDVMRFAFTNGAAYFSMAPGRGTAVSYQDWQRNYADFNNVAFAYDTNGNSYGIATGLDTYPNGQSTFAGRFTFVTSRWGIGNTGDMNDNYFGYHKLRLESVGMMNGAYVQGSPVTEDYIMDTRRFNSPVLATAVHGAETSIYLAYYDRFQKQIRFRYGTFENAAGTPAPTGTSTSATGNFDQFRDQHSQGDVKNAATHYLTTANSDNAKWAFDATADDYSLIAGVDARNTSLDTGNVAGKYVAIDVVPGATTAADVVVAVWYDDVNKNLRYSYKMAPYSDFDADQTARTGAARSNYWSVPKTIFTDGGKFCAIKVDQSAGHGIHIAAQDSSGQNLKYAYLSSFDALDSGSVTPVTIDSYGIVGTQVQIDTQIERIGTTSTYVVVPYISYFNGATEKPKMAHLVPQASMNYAANGSIATSELYTGKWEVTLIPTDSEVQDDHVNIGLWKTTAGSQRINVRNVADIAGGDVVGTNSGSTYGNGTGNAVVGYATVDGTQGYIETAQKQ